MYCSCVLNISQAFDRVIVNTSFSGLAKIRAGVPQEGILSPLLYNIYAADQLTSPYPAVAEFADDKAIISIHDVIGICNSNCNQISLRAEIRELTRARLVRDAALNRIVIRNLHSSTPIKLIKDELEVRLFKVRQVTNVLHKVNKNPLPLYFVDLEPTPKSKEIFELSFLLHTKIKIEEPYKSKIISQYLNCQEYGHTRAYCGYHPRCIRCGAGHQASDCPNPRNSPPKCALCSENHPANYKGCSIYRDLQRRKKPTSKSNIVADNTRYKSSNVQSSHPQNDSFSNIHLSSDQPKTYAQATSNQSNTHPHPSTPLSPDADVNKILSSFLEKFESLISRLLSLLTKVISNLLDKKND
eukprot:XP_016658204.1 PREDICTED: nucleic-acid-binding protein from mobile element jockey-like [Acyrthosiphon pisum]